MYKDQD